MITSVPIQNHFFLSSIALFYLYTCHKHYIFCLPTAVSTHCLVYTISLLCTHTQASHTASCTKPYTSPLPVHHTHPEQVLNATKDVPSRSRGQGLEPRSTYLSRPCSRLPRPHTTGVHTPPAPVYTRDQLQEGSSNYCTLLCLRSAKERLSSALFF